MGIRLHDALAVPNCTYRARATSERVVMRTSSRSRRSSRRGELAAMGAWPQPTGMAGPRRAAWLATGSACGAGHEERWAASCPHQRRLLRGRLLARFGESSDWARREREWI